LSKVSAERYILVTENLSMQDLFKQVAQSLGVRVPQQEAKPWLLKTARIAEWLKEKLTGKKALVTKETVKNASLRFYYDSSKLMAAVPFKPTSIQAAIEQTASYFKQQKKA
jgi:nucleoside-diphosphate-sugar epimerase